MAQVIDLEAVKLARINAAGAAAIAREAQVTRLTCAETAKRVRAALKAAFPGMTFSVRSREYAGGASIDVRWTDGPTTKEVDHVVKAFEGATFDGMIDLKEYKQPVMLDGKRVRFDADYVSCQRDISYDLLLACAQRISKQYDVAMPEIHRSCWTHKGKTHTNAWVDRGGEPLDRSADGTVANYGSTAGDKTMELAYATSAYTPPQNTQNTKTPAEA